MDLDSYSLNDLKHLKKQIDKAIDTFEERALENARLELEEHAKSLGYTLDQLTQTKPKKWPRKIAIQMIALEHGLGADANLLGLWISSILDER